MKKWYLFPALVLLVLFFNACQKETSFEGSRNPAEGTLQSELSGECLPKTVNGIYEAGTTLDVSNYIDVTVDVIAPGQYKIYTDTLNGVYFSGAGFFSTAGEATVRLRGVGTPLASGTDNFTVLFGASTCSVAVITLPEGAGGPAAFTLTGAPNACANAVVDGIYTANTALNGTNTVTLQVNVTTIGVYDITTAPVNGMTFHGTGTLGATGPATVVLTGQGTPVLSGQNFISVPGTSSCTFEVNVVGPAEFTLDCANAVATGNYNEGVQLTGANVIQVTATVTKAGSYTLSGTVNGMTFSFTGTFLITGVQPIGLQGSGIPLAGGVFQVPISGNGVTCSVPVTVTAAPAVDWKFTEGVVTFSGEEAGATLDQDPSTPAKIFEYDGDNSDNETIYIALVDIDGVFNVGEVYNTNNTSATTNLAQFEYSNVTDILYSADPTLPGVNIKFTITSFNTTAKTFTGTYSGTAFNSSNVSKPITSGTFKGTYQ